MDATATIQKVDVKKLRGERTFPNHTYVLLRRLVNLARGNGSNEIHFVADTYRDMWIKNAERAKRAVGGSQVIRVYRQAIPLQWFLIISRVVKTKKRCSSVCTKHRRQ